MKPQIKYFPLSIVPVYFGFTTDKAAFEREMKRLGFDDEGFNDHDACTHTFNINKAKGHNHVRIIVTLNCESAKSQSSSEIAGLVAHEAYHVVCSIMEAMMEQKPGEETVAYAIQYLTKIMLDELKCP